jgi:hypothetical protein
MTQEERNLLVKELSSRLPYLTYVEWNDGYALLTSDRLVAIISNNFGNDWKRPFLRSMSSMTDEEKEHLQLLHDIISDENYGDGYSPAAWGAISEFNDYCHTHHLDNRGLIGKGLALEAPEQMYD